MFWKFILIWSAMLIAEYSSAQIPLQCLNKPNGTKVPDVLDCKVYTLCNGTESKILTCETGKIFDEREQDCLKGQCGGLQCLDKPYGYKIADSEDCQKYIICLGTTSKPGYCEPGTVFHQQQQKCIIGTCEGCMGKPNNYKMPDKNDCTKFIVCVENNPYTVSCEFGTIFDESQQKCISGNCGQPSGCIGKPNGHKIPDNNDCTKFIMCLGNNSQNGACEIGTIFDEKQQKCISGNCYQPSECMGKPNGYKIPDNNDCTKFIICLGNNSQNGACEIGTIFDEKQQKCISGNCGQPSGCIGKPNGHKIPDNNDCTKFIMCLGNNSQNGACEIGTFFDEQQQNCISGNCYQPSECMGKPNGYKIPDNNDCTKFIICLGNNSQNGACEIGTFFDEQQQNCISGNCYQPSECMGKPNGYKIPDNNDCTKFIICLGNNSQNGTCEIGTIFDGQQQNCIGGNCNQPSECIGKPNGYKIPDKNDCTKFIICLGNNSKYGSCVLGTMFSEQQQKCILGNCDSVDCSREPHGKIFPHATNCRLFWQCVEGHAVQRFCEIGMWFDRERFVCNFPKYVKNCPANTQ